MVTGLHKTTLVASKFRRRNNESFWVILNFNSINNSLFQPENENLGLQENN
jgi:hypothetical protein